MFDCAKATYWWTLACFWCQVTGKGEERAGLKAAEGIVVPCQPPVCEGWLSIQPIPEPQAIEKEKERTNGRGEIHTHIYIYIKKKGSYSKRGISIINLNTEEEGEHTSPT